MNRFFIAGMEAKEKMKETYVKNNLPIGTVLELNGYDNPSFCIIKNLGLTPGFEAYGTKYKVINIANGQASIKDATHLDHISKKDKEIKGIHTYFTDTVLDPEAIMDLIKKSEAKKAADVKAIALNDQARALELETLQRDYAHLETVAGNKKSSYAVGAANIRKELKAAFPKIKFSVTSEGYSMGCSINISWEDALSPAEVEKIVSKYEYGTFDAMTDCAGSIDSQFIDLFGGARFVNTHRRLSISAYNKTAVTMGYPTASFDPKKGAFDGVDYEISEMIKREAWKTIF